MGVLAEIQSEMKRAFFTGAMEKQAIQYEHWKDKRKLYEKQRHLKNFHAKQIAKKKNTITTLKKINSDEVSKLKSELSVMRKSARELKRENVGIKT